LALKCEWFKLLKEDEIGRDEKTGDEFPYFHGLKRLAELAGKTKERITHCNMDKIVKANPTYYNLIAQVVVEVEFDDGTSWTGAADAHLGNCKDFRNHPTALAETRALGRAYRRALNIRQASYEEISEVPEEQMTGEPSGPQIKLILKICKELDMEPIDIIKKVSKRDDVIKVEDFNLDEAEQAARILNEMRAAKNKEVKKKKKKAAKEKAE